MRISFVSTSTRSPGCAIRKCLGLRMAHGQFRRPRRLTHLVRAMRVLFQGGQIVAVEAPLPAIESLPADAKVPAGPRPVPTIEKIKQHPLKACLGGPAYLPPEARQLARLGKLIPS